MAFEYLGANALDYDLCDYGSTKRQFRGPELKTDRAYYAAIGGTETFGKFVEEPYPKILQELSGVPVANLGQMYSGAQYAFDEVGVLDICNSAEATIIQLTCIQNMTNKYYSVHPRRNDRFLEASALLRSIYPDVDFTVIHFTGHLMHALYSSCPRRFGEIISDLRQDWVCRVHAHLSILTNRVILLWMASNEIDEDARTELISSEPMFVQNEMLDDLAASNCEIVKVIATPDELAAGYDRMIFNPVEEPAAENMLGPIVHQEVAKRLAKVLKAH